MIHSDPLFQVLSSRPETVKNVYKTTKLFLKLQDELSMNFDTDKKLAAVPEDILANLNLLVGALHADAKEHKEKYGKKALSEKEAKPEEPAPKMVESKTEKKSKKRIIEESAGASTAAVTAGGDREEPGLSRWKRKKSGSE